MNILKTTTFWKITTVILGFMIFLPSVWPMSLSHQKEDSQSSTEFKIIKTVNAQNLYPKFTCPCCGQPLNKENPCCEAMTSIIDYIDKRTGEGLSEEEVMLQTVKEFGIGRLTGLEDQKVIRNKLAKMAPEDAPRLTISEIERDIGKVSKKQGKVSTDFEIVNDGESDLVINKLSSSCGCTSGSILYQGVEGPLFTMEGHGKDNPTNWQVAISPQDKAILRVDYDPSVHPDFVGDATRTVSVFSNDPVDFEQKVTINLFQTQ